MAEQDNFELLNQINYPEDLRKMALEQLPQVCQELRKDIIKEVAVNPGHLASSLGVVEITVALHYVFNTPDDRLVWDVGHQAYGHKILTGRRKEFCTNRKLNGLRPFPSPLESEYDTFTCGHASNSISAALGMAVAARERENERTRERENEGARGRRKEGKKGGGCDWRRSDERRIGFRGSEQRIVESERPADYPQRQRYVDRSCRRRYGEIPAALRHERNL